MPRPSPAVKKQAAMTVPGADLGRGRAGTDAERDRLRGHRGCPAGAAAAVGRVLAGGRGIVPAALRVGGRVAAV